MRSNPLALLWIGKATIYHYETVTDENTYESKQQTVVTASDEPCRVSYNNIAYNKEIAVGSGVTNVNQIITLFIRPDIIIPPGSMIDVTQHGNTVKYKASTQQALYTNHQEISLELYEDHA